MPTATLAASSANPRVVAPSVSSIDELLASVDDDALFELTPAEVRGLIVELERVRARVDVVQSRAVGRFDREAMSCDDGFRSSRAWLCQRTQMARATASRNVKTARALRSLPVVAASFAAGRLSLEQVAAFASVLNPRTEQAMEVDEEHLVHLAEGLVVDALRAELREWQEAVDPDGARPAAGHRSRHLAMSQGLDGQMFGQFEFGAADGVVLKDAVEQMSEWLFECESKSTDVDGPPMRTPSQRRADALVELVRRGLATLRGTSEAPARPRPALTLLVTLEDLESGRSARTDRGDRVPAVALDRLACECDVTALGWSVDGVPLSHGRTKRLPTAAQRRAAFAQHGGCWFPGCDAPAEWGDVHHVRHWTRDNGPTDQPNLVPLCSGTHHAMFHEGGWDIRVEADGAFTILHPDGSVYDPRPGWN